MDTRKMAEDNLMLFTVVGSTSYGTNTATSDKDYKGIFFADPENVITPFFPVEQVQGFRGHKDSEVYELRKFLKLLCEQNPNILELLWVDEKFIEHRTPQYDILRDAREHLLSSQAKHTFSGYAYSQLLRIKGHNKWIQNPQPLRRPKEIDFVSVVWNYTSNSEWNTKVPFVNYDAYSLGDNIFGLIDASTGKPWHDNHEALVYSKLSDLRDLVDKTSVPMHEVSFDLIVKFNKQLYKDHVDNWKSYWEWKKNRNEARSELEAKHGYDTKHAKLI